ncbi:MULTISPECIES: hypothetical protein [Vibrio harveyi group]|uniref:hypothetical protein n=1 Tax=Vibrio harveyi group TaxID=717610 RepID=UPI00111F54A3|nr:MULTISPECIES: hypothetical protein [Vibrio harveyi group]EIK4762123.1 hypothetical protein [Vibrio parahaemolyticus]EJE4675962.1 hypothetical protein [Vibrio parahaemolyticus]EJG1572101.1 hypothetical protein [Vibrio parahaemolyticus]EJG1668013.1 hypothetical protein [Vibrio parahaemolyticus]EJG1776012.1 hypothetical protein [Vibrio parahaemolyticus]
MDYLGYLVGFIGVFVSWHYGTRTGRLVKKADKYKAQIDKLEAYASPTGYKVIMKDGFHTLFYVLALVTFGISLQTFTPLIITHAESAEFVSQLSGSMIMGASLVSFSQFLSLSKLYRKDKELKKLQDKVEKIRKEVNPEI